MSISEEEDYEVFDSCDLDPVTGLLPEHPVSASIGLADHTTFHLGGSAHRFVVADSQKAIIDEVTRADDAGEPLLVLGGGSNMVVGDEGFDGTVVRVANRGVNGDISGCGGAVITVAAGESWDDFVQLAVSQGWRGTEALSGIPGLVGSTVIQNVGAYGTDVASFVYRVRTWDRVERGYRTFANADCLFGYRDSIFKRTRMPDVGTSEARQNSPTGRFIVLEVTFQFLLGDLSMPVKYAELAKRLGIEIGERVAAADVRREVLSLRSGKGMVVDENDHDSWSAGSFFTNPIISTRVANLLPDDAPRYPVDEGSVKTSAAWLIDHAGFHKGFGAGKAKISSKHTLALTNRGGATSAEVLELAAQIRDGVRDKYGIVLVPEPVFVGIEDWPDSELEISSAVAD